MRRNQRMPEDTREFPIIGDQYDDEESSYLPLQDDEVDGPFWEDEEGE